MAFRDEQGRAMGVAPRRRTRKKPVPTPQPLNQARNITRGPLGPGTPRVSPVPERVTDRSSGQRHAAAQPQHRPAYRLPSGPRGDAPQTRQRDTQRADAYKRTADYRGAIRASYKGGSRRDAQRALERYGQASQTADRYTARRQPELYQRSVRTMAQAQQDYESARTYTATPLRQARIQGAVQRDNAGKATPEDQALLRTHRAELQRNRILKEGAAGFTGMSDADRRRAQQAYALPAFQDALVEAKRHRTMEGPRLLPGTRDSSTGQVAKDPARKAKEETAQEIRQNLQQSGVGADKVVQALNQLEKRHESPAVTAMRQLTRGSSMTAGAARGGLFRGDLAGAAKGAAHGLIKNDQSWRDVAHDVGLRGTAANIAGFTGDVVLDPTTYASFGWVTPALATARTVKAAKLAEGATEDAALTAAREAFDEAAKKGKHASGISLGLRGTPVRIGSVVSQMARGKGLRQAYRDSTRHVKTSGGLTSRLNPRKQDVRPVTGADAAVTQLGYKHRPANIHPVDFEHQRDAARAYRAKLTQAEETGRRTGKAYDRFIRKKGITEADQVEVNLALDADELGRLTPKQRELAEFVQRDYAHVAELERRTASQRIGRREEPEVPEVTANVAGRRDDLRRSIADLREAIKAEKGLAKAQGRSEVLSRNVSGSTAEARVEKALRALDRAEKAAGKPGGAPADVLKHMDAVEEALHPHNFAGGGKGVKDALARLSEGVERNLGPMRAKDRLSAREHNEMQFLRHQEDLGPALQARLDELEAKGNPPAGVEDVPPKPLTGADVTHEQTVRNAAGEEYTVRKHGDGTYTAVSKDGKRSSPPLKDHDQALHFARGEAPKPKPGTNGSSPLNGLAQRKGTDAPANGKTNGKYRVDPNDDPQGVADGEKYWVTAPDGRSIGAARTKKEAQEMVREDQRMQRRGEGNGNGAAPKETPKEFGPKLRPVSTEDLGKRKGRVTVRVQFGHGGWSEYDTSYKELAESIAEVAKGKHPGWARMQVMPFRANNMKATEKWAAEHGKASPRDLRFREEVELPASAHDPFTEQKKDLNASFNAANISRLPKDMEELDRWERAARSPEAQDAFPSWQRPEAALETFATIREAIRRSGETPPFKPSNEKILQAWREVGAELREGKWTPPGAARPDAGAYRGTREAYDDAKSLERDIERTVEDFGALERATWRRGDATKENGWRGDYLWESKQKLGDAYGYRISTKTEDDGVYRLERWDPETESYKLVDAYSTIKEAKETARLDAEHMGRQANADLKDHRDFISEEFGGKFNDVLDRIRGGGKQPGDIPPLPNGHADVRSASGPLHDYQILPDNTLRPLKKDAPRSDPSPFPVPDRGSEVTYTRFTPTPEEKAPPPLAGGAPEPHGVEQVTPLTPVERPTTQRPAPPEPRLERTGGKRLEDAIADVDKAREALRAERRQKGVESRARRAAEKDYENWLTEAKGYTFRLRRTEVDPKFGRGEGTFTQQQVPGGGNRGRKINYTADKHRKTPERLELMPEAQRAEYVLDNIPLQMARRTADSERQAALRELQDRIGALGHPVKNWDDVERAAREDLANLYIRDDKGWTQVWKPGRDSQKLAEQKVAKALRSGREIRAVPEDVWQHAWDLANRGRGSLSANPVAGAFDRAQGMLKTGQTVVNLGYHVTNLIGDTFAARIGGASAKDIADGWRMAYRDRHNRRFLNDLENSFADARKHGKDGRSIYYKGLGRKATDREIFNLALDHGAAGQGYAGNELRRLTEHTENVRRPVRGAPSRAMDFVRFVNEAREDASRMGSFVAALKRGDDPAAAGRHVTNQHFDYSDLTEAERAGARRLVPFWTFWARNVPLQARAIVGNPGRYATVQKTRDALANQVGLDDDWEAGLPDYVQQQAPFPVPGVKVDSLPLAANLKLPLTDLNIINPGNPREAGFAALNRIGTMIKTPAEMVLGYDTFTRREMKGDSKWVPAPDLPGKQLDKIMQGIVESMGSVPGAGTPTVEMRYDRKSGQKVPKWPWWIDKVWRTLPATSAIGGAFTPGRDAHHRGALNLIGYGAGARPFTLDPDEARTSRLFDDLSRSEDRTNQMWGALSPEEKADDNHPVTKKVKQRRKRESAMKKQIAKLTEGQGDYFANMLPKKRAPSPYAGAAKLRSSGGVRYTR